MNIDPNNPVVKLCAQGVQIEMAGDKIRASKLYKQAWDKKSNTYEACIAAHYMARVQPTPEDSLLWNQKALECASGVTDKNIETFLPSLYLNVGKSYEDLGNKTEAKKYYELGLNKSAVLPNDRLGNMTKDGLERGVERVK